MPPQNLDPIDPELMRLRRRLPPDERIQALLDARERAPGLIRGRLQFRYPDLTSTQINLKVLEEIERASRRSIPRF